VIVAAMFMNGFSIDRSISAFEKLSKVAFTRRKRWKVPLLSRAWEIILSYLGDSLYPADSIEGPLKSIFGTNRSILDGSYAASIGAKVGLPVATVHNAPSCKIFTNYNAIGERDREQGKGP
jgi:hypothetical protein